MFDIVNVDVTVALVTYSQKYQIGEQGHGFKNLLKRGLRKTIIYNLVKPNSTKNQNSIEGQTYVTKFFLENGKIDQKGKILNFNINVQT